MWFSFFYGPVKPHFGQRYDLPNFRHLEHRQMVISPQLGHRNFVASVLGAMIRWHELHMGTATAFSVTLIPQREFGMEMLLYMCCV